MTCRARGAMRAARAPGPMRAVPASDHRAVGSPVPAPGLRAVEPTAPASGHRAMGPARPAPGRPFAKSPPLRGALRRRRALGRARARRPRATRRMPPWAHPPPPAPCGSPAHRAPRSHLPPASRPPRFSRWWCGASPRASAGALPAASTAWGARRIARSRSQGNSSLSRHHALLTVSARGLVVRDEGSANGTYVEGSRVATGEDVPVRPGGWFALSNERFVLEA